MKKPKQQTLQNNIQKDVANKQHAQNTNAEKEENKTKHKFVNLLEQMLERKNAEINMQKEERLRKKQEKARKKHLQPYLDELVTELRTYQKDVCDFVVLDVPKLKYRTNAKGEKQEVYIFKLEESNLIVCMKNIYKNNVLIENKYCYLDKNLSFNLITTTGNEMIVAKRFFFGKLEDECKTYSYQTVCNFNLINLNLKKYSEHQLYIYKVARQIITQAETTLFNLEHTYNY